MEWFNAKIKYLKQLENGSIAKVSESYLLNALSFTEAEARLQGILEEYISEYQLKALTPINIQDVIIDDSKDNFFKTKVFFIDSDPDTEKEKKINESYMVQANNSAEAIEKLSERLKGSIVDFEIVSTSKTSILDVFPYEY